MANILAIDTTTSSCSAALSSGDELITKCNLAERSHTKLILPMIDEVLSKSSLTLDKLDYKEKTNQLDSGGNIPNYASILFRKFFEFLKDENPDVIIKVTAEHDKFHKQYRSRHNFRED